MVDFLFGAALEGTRGSLSGGSNGKAWVVETSSWWLVLAHFVLLAASTNRRDRRWLSAWCVNGRDLVLLAAQIKARTQVELRYCGACVRWNGPSVAILKFETYFETQKLAT